MAAGDRRRGLGVVAGEDIVAGVLAPDDDPGHDWLLSIPLSFLVRHHNGGAGRGFQARPTRASRVVVKVV